MFRALSTQKSRGGGEYEQLADEPLIGVLQAKLRRSATLPAKLFGSSSKRLAAESNAPVKQAKKASKIHPFFSLFETRRKKKATAKPEFARYLQYVKEGGVWDVNSNVPVIYYK
ncbi:uncharacterized protein LOC132267536 [Cornus florida]|uniref:uncharacterized protein LOC132267536 n=1 Tax=Cornus florida TaxID=4283 RepID=UPI00289F2F41|nr:uncharacterized protein LOC132267536 [Cornus florida]